MSTPSGYNAPVNPRLTYAASLARLNTLFAGDDLSDQSDSVGPSADIAPDIFYGPGTVKSLRYFDHEPDWMADPIKRRKIENKTRHLLRRYRYVVVGTERPGTGKHQLGSLERVLLKGPHPAHHELAPMSGPQRNAAENWRFRSGLLSYPQALALCTHLNSFRRNPAHGRVLFWSICEGPGPDADLGAWLKARCGDEKQLHRSVDDLTGFGIDGAMGRAIACFKFCCNGRFEGNFSYLPPAPVIEPLFHIDCQSSNSDLAPVGHISVRLGQRSCQVASRSREDILKYADYAGAYPELEVSETGLEVEQYYFRSDEGWTGVPFGPCHLRPHQTAASLFTAEETQLVMKHLHRIGFHHIRRVQDLKAHTIFPENRIHPEDGVMKECWHTIAELALTLHMECTVRF